MNKIVALINQAEVVVKNSRFLSYRYSIKNKDDIESILKNLKLLHPKAVHFVYSYLLKNDQGLSAKINDDGEPKGSAAKPIFRIMQLKNITNEMVIIIRYWGGSKLGIGPLTRAYTKAASLLF
ncbi:uncharacterized protein UPF0029 [Mycoplasma testudineum]|uniref:Uncharacterized protein UPF0029 n=1 Tax=Mycoplasma testudineum TaxID=244584 RepID=A0A4R6IJN7_9MOLU|nr:YigZ family protein [Mycoplasma testudineum]OYD26453.1 proline dipeptidase [Mycoplasma testudineum]TDO22155.1 uncharacterized protein UPF0029 [Mycoplasma testudineum]